MLRRIFFLGLIAGIAGLGVFWWLTMPAARWAATVAYTPNPKNGEIIFNACGCSSCHAVPGQPDRTRLGGGFPVPSPFCPFDAPNISQDPNDGIGHWTDAEFVNAVMRGISPEGTHYFPVFPYTSYSHAT